ncbi:MAG: hypothetical protein GYB34_13430 [Gammaproteobacteria bacterium]|nr:hypothetical protein [Gammaproteobacteria bacterium]
MSKTEFTPIKVKDVILKHMSGPSPTCEERTISAPSEWGLLKTTAIVWDGWNAKAHKVPPKQFWGNKNIEVKAGDVLVTKAGPRERVGVVVYVDETPSNLMVSGKMIGLRPNHREIDYRVLAALLSSEKVQRFLDARTTGMADSQLNFTNDLLLSTLIEMPPKHTHAKLGDLISTIDNNIRLTEALIDKYKQIKAGLMHDLFARGVTADGKLRPPREQAPELYQETPIGWIPKDWDYFNLGALYSEPARNGLYKPAEFHGRGPLIVNMGNIFSSLYVDFENAERVDVTDQEYRIFHVKDGDLLFGRRSLVLEGAGKCALVKNIPGASTFESSIIRVRLKNELISPKFASLFLSTEMAYRDRRRFIRQVAVSGISGEDLKQFSVPVPPPNEQLKICERVDAVLNKIHKEQETMMKLRKQKFGLMHDLLAGIVKVQAEEPGHV